MTNEELVVFDSLVTELIEKREQSYTFRTQRDEITAEHELRVKEKERLLEDLNRLRESEANALNAAEEAKRERDEARKKLCEWVRFVNDSIYPALDKATELKNCRNIVKVSVKAMRKFIYEHPVEVIEGELEK